MTEERPSQEREPVKVPAEDLASREALERNTDIEFFRASGPGGQHRNRRETGVRLHHVPTGVVVTATERRSQARNRDVAFERLAERLEAMAVTRRERRPTRPSRGAVERRIADKRQQSQRKKQRTLRLRSDD